MIDITPDDLMTSPATAEMPVQFEYSHSAQKSVTMQDALDSVQLSQYQTAYCMTTSTFNGTQTYDFQGRPWDNDNDSDNSGDC